MAMKEQTAPIIEVRELKKYFPVGRGWMGKPRAFARAVDGVSFFIKDSETLGLVGESGSGKTTVGRMIARLTKQTGGSILFQGRNISQIRQSQLKPFRREIQMVFQDPYSSLNPRMTAKDLVAEPFFIHRLVPRIEINDQVARLFQKVGLRSEQMSRYPHEFSGGQRQRIGIARALSLNPRLIVADEPVSSLDVSVQAQVINLFTDLQADLGLSYLFISHDISIVAHISHRIAVMYLGKLFEVADTMDLLNRPFHPYTKSLLNAVPIPNPKLRRKRYEVATGDLPSSINPPSGCRFRTRCQYAFDWCKENVPALREVEKDHFVACHLESR